MHLPQACRDAIEESAGGWRGWYEQWVKLGPENHAGWCEIACPFHGDSNPSAGVNVRDGGFNCFPCGGGGDFITFYQQIQELQTPKEAIYRISVDQGILVEITEQTAAECHQSLIQSQEAIAQVCRQLGITEKVIREFRIGLHAHEKERSVRITIPILGETGHIEDIRRYLPGAKERKWMSWCKGSGGCRVFPRKSLDNFDLIYLVEGEKDCLALIALGIDRAICVTGGAGNFPENYLELFRGKIVYICYDIDAAGKKGAEAIIRKLSLCAEAIYLIHLPEEGLPSNGDISDWLALGNGVAEWELLVASAEKVGGIAPNEESVVEIDRTASLSPEVPETTTAVEQDAASCSPIPDEVKTIDLSDIWQITSPSQWIQFEARNIGIASGGASFRFPKRFRLECERHDPKGICRRCPIMKLDADVSPYAFRVRSERQGSLQLINCTDQEARRALLRQMNIPTECGTVRIYEDEVAEATEIALIAPPRAEGIACRGEVDVPRAAIYMGPPLSGNQIYRFIGRIQKDPKNQRALLNLQRAERIGTSIDNFCWDDRALAAVAYFRRRDESVGAHIGRILSRVEKHIGLVGRGDMLLACSQVAFSAREFYLNRERVFPGVVDLLAIGDTRTGKSHAAQRFAILIGAGAYMTCHAVSLAGLIGGLETIDGRRLPVLGILPRNHGGFVTLDEVDELVTRGTEGINLIASTASIRSSGIAEIVKIQHLRAEAVVRMLWITNAAGKAPIASFGGAAYAIEGVIPGSAHIARFTAAIAVSRQSLAGLDLAAVVTEPMPEEELEQWRTLVAIAWWLGPDQIRFTDEAERYLRAEAGPVAERYECGLELIGASTSLFKLARLSVPIAVLCGSFEENEKVELIVRKEHCEFAVLALRYAYDHPDFALLTRARAEKALEANFQEEKIFALFKKLDDLGHVQVRDLARFLLSQGSVTCSMFSEMIGKPELAREAWSILIRSGSLTLGSSGRGLKSPRFAEFLRRLL